MVWIICDSWVPMPMNSFDIDGVITVGLYPGPSDVIITGRSFEEEPETKRMLRGKGIHNPVYFNPLPWADKTRKSSGEHKARIINELGITLHFEDDPIQIDVIQNQCPRCTVVAVVHNLTEKENVRHV